MSSARFTTAVELPFFQQRLLSLLVAKLSQIVDIYFFNTKAPPIFALFLSRKAEGKGPVKPWQPVRNLENFGAKSLRQIAGR